MYREDTRFICTNFIVDTVARNAIVSECISYSEDLPHECVRKRLKKREINIYICMYVKEEKEILSKGKKEKTSAAFSYRQSRPAPSLLLFSWSKPLAFCQGESTPHDHEKTMRLRELRRSPLTYTHIHSTWLSGRRPGKRVSCGKISRESRSSRSRISFDLGF